MADGLFTSKDFSLKKLNLITSHGQTLPLRGIAVELQIRQDIYDSTMNGELFCNDANDVFVNFALSGNDYIEIEIEKGFARIQKLFRIYKVTDRKPNKNSVSNYSLHFCSDERILSESTRMSKSYKGKRADEIVEDILTKVLRVPDSKLDLWERTSGTYDLVIPYTKPLEAIQWVTARSYDASGKFCYFFYENALGGYCFQSMQSLFTQETDKKLHLGIKADSTDPSKNQESIDRFTILNDYDVILSTAQGSIASRTIGVDTINQTYNQYDYSLEAAEGSGWLLNANKQINSVKMVDGNTNMRQFNSRLTVYPQIHEIQQWMPQRVLHMAAMNGFRLQVVLPGDLFIQVGTVFEVDMPQFKAPDETGKPMDNQRSGKYMVTGVNHKFVDDIFESIVELSTDSYKEPIPQAIDLTPLVMGKK